MMTHRLRHKIREAKRLKKKLFCAFLTLGFLDLKTTAHLIEEFEKAGVDIVELGFPFSDPLADGPTIQYSSEYALKKGVRIKDAFMLVKQLRAKGVKIPILFFGYANPILHFGKSAFINVAKNAGFDGCIIPDLPPEEEIDFARKCRRTGFDQILLVAPTTLPERAKKIVRASGEFTYYVSVRGVTGARKSLPADVASNLKSLKKMTSKPILIGFGISNPKQAAGMAKISDGVIVGSAIVSKIRSAKGSMQPVLGFVKAMVRAVKR